MSHIILINNETMTFLKATNTVEQSEYWAEILAPTCDTRITDVSGKAFSVYTQLELRMLYFNTVGEQVPDRFDYSKLIQGLKHLANELIVDDTSVSELEAKLGRKVKTPDPTPVKECGRKPVIGGGQGSTEVKRPKEGSTTAKVWEICDAMYADRGEIPVRKDVLLSCETHGISTATASTQYSKWKKSLIA